MMMPIRFKITQDEFYVIYNTATTAHIATEAAMLRPIISINTVLMAEWKQKGDRQNYIWYNRVNTKEYAYTLPNSTALALHQLLCLNCPNHAGQTLLEKLNRHLVNAGFKPETVEYQ